MGEGNGSATELTAAKRKDALILVLCKFLSISPDTLPKAHLECSDLKSLCVNLVQSSGKQNLIGTSSDDREEIYKWLAFSDSFHSDTNSSLSKLKFFDEALVQRSVLLGKGLYPSVADVVVWASLHDSVVGLAASDRKNVPNLMRWFDYIQNKVDFSPVFEKINLEKPKFRPEEAKGGEKTSVINASVKTDDSDRDKKRNDGVEKEREKKNAKEEKKKNEDKKKNEAREPVEKKETETSVTVLDIRVGVIRKAWKHPSADSLLVEEIDAGEEKVRQVVSGLAKYYSADELLNRRVLVVTNVKPGKLREVMSAGLVLCASNQDHSIVEPLLPPAEAKIGEQVTFVGQEGKPEEVLNPKKKQLEKITPHLYTDANGVATYKGIPFTTSAGLCRSSLTSATIK